MRRLPIDCCVYGKEIFYGYEHDLLRSTLSSIKDNIPSNTKLDTVYKVFIYFLYLVVKDIITKGVSFRRAPNATTKLSMEEVKGDDFKLAYSKGAFQDVDFRLTDNTAYRVKLSRINTVNKSVHVMRKTKNIYLGYKVSRYIADKINKGYRYPCETNIVRQ